MYVEGFLPASLCLVTLFNSEPCSQFERFHLQHVQMVNKTSSFKTKLLGYDAKASRIHFTFDVSHSHVLEGRLPVGNHSSAYSENRSWPPLFNTRKLTWTKKDVLSVLK